MKRSQELYINAKLHFLGCFVMLILAQSTTNTVISYLLTISAAADFLIYIACLLRAMKAKRLENGIKWR